MSIVVASLWGEMKSSHVGANEQRRVNTRATRMTVGIDSWATHKKRSKGVRRCVGSKAPLLMSGKRRGG